MRESKPMQRLVLAFACFTTLGDTTASHAFFDVGLASRRQFDISVAIKQASSGTGSLDGMAGAQEMMQNLYLGCAKAAQNRDLLQRLGIKSILIVADDEHPCFPNDYNYMEIPAKDVPSQDLLSKFESAFEFLDKARAAGPVLVHCACGMSRSATIVVAYIMKIKGRSLDATMRTARTKRQICPNKGFLTQLRVFEWAKCDLTADFAAAKKAMEASGAKPTPQIKLLGKVSEQAVRRAVPVGGDQSAIYVQHRRKLHFRSRNALSFFTDSVSDNTIAIPSRNPSVADHLNSAAPSRAQSTHSMPSPQGSHAANLNGSCRAACPPHPTLFDRIVTAQARNASRVQHEM